MQFAGQIWGHRPQATHLARPCSSVSMRCVPRQRGESVQSLLLLSSGYCIVTFGRHRWVKVRRKRGRVHRTQMYTKRKPMTLRENIPSVRRVLSGDHGGVLSQCVKGISHPPKKRVVMSADAVTMFEYSAM